MCPVHYIYTYVDLISQLTAIIVQISKKAISQSIIEGKYKNNSHFWHCCNISQAISDRSMWVIEATLFCCLNWQLHVSFTHRHHNIVKVAPLRELWQVHTSFQQPVVQSRPLRSASVLWQSVLVFFSSGCLSRGVLYRHHNVSKLRLVRDCVCVCACACACACVCVCVCVRVCASKGTN